MFPVDPADRVIATGYGREAHNGARPGSNRTRTSELDPIRMGLPIAGSRNKGE